MDEPMDQFVAWVKEQMSKPRPSGWWWLSFCDPTKPEGEQFVGVAIVDACSFVHALFRARRLGCNPGCEVAGEPLTVTPAPGWCGRLLTREEAAAAGGGLLDIDGRSVDRKMS